MVNKASLVTVARRKANGLSSLNPVAALGHEFRRTRWPKKPGRPPRIDGTVVIPGGKRRRRGPVGDTKNDLR